jgi:hypothetical protein
MLSKPFSLKPFSNSSNTMTHLPVYNCLAGGLASPNFVRRQLSNKTIILSFCTLKISFKPLFLKIACATMYTNLSLFQLIWVCYGDYKKSWSLGPSRGPRASGKRVNYSDL